MFGGVTAGSADNDGLHSMACPSLFGRVVRFRWVCTSPMAAPTSRSIPRSPTRCCCACSTRTATETRLSLPGMDAGVWHGFVDGVQPGQEYGFRVHGPYDPAPGSAATRQSCCSTPMPGRSAVTVAFGPSVYGHDLDNPGRPSDLDSAVGDAAQPDGRPAAAGRARTPRAACRPAPAGPAGISRTPCSTRSTSRASPRRIRTSRRDPRAPTPDSRTRRRSHTCSGWGSPRWNCCRCSTACRRHSWSSGA